MLLLVLNTALSLTTLVVLLWGVGLYIRARHEIRKLISLLYTKMDDLLEGLLAEENTAAVAQPQPAEQPQPTTAAQPQPKTAAAKRERLAIISAGGRARQYLGKAWSMEEINVLGDDEVRKLHTLYEARLGASITKTLGRAALQLYADVVSLFLPIPPENRQPLVAELESDPFVDHALTSIACEMYYHCGNLLAPFTAALTTLDYCQFGHQCPRRMEEDGLERQQCDSTGGVAEANGGACFEGDGHAGGTQPAF